MPSLISDAQKIELGDALNNVFLTFSRDILIWRQANTVIVSSDPNQFNFIYANNQPANVIEYQPISGIFQGSINWSEPNSFNEKELRPNIDGSLCQVDLLDDGYAFMTSGVYEQIIVDGVSCSINAENSFPRLHGLFDTRYKCVYLRRNN